MTTPTITQACAYKTFQEPTLPPSPPISPSGGSPTIIKLPLQIHHDFIGAEGTGGRALARRDDRLGAVAADHAAVVLEDDGVVPGHVGLEVAGIVREVHKVRAGCALVFAAGDDGRAVGAGGAAVEGPLVGGGGGGGDEGQEGGG